jgi:uncharacterized membrane protein YgcG
VSKRWAAAAACKEVFRRRMHCNVLETLFNPQHTKQQQHKQQQDKPQDALASTDSDQQQQQQQQQQDPTAAVIAAVAAVGLSPARLFVALYGTNLLLNGSFLERLNTYKGANRRLVWVSGAVGWLESVGSGGGGTTGGGGGATGGQGGKGQQTAG